MGRTKESPVSKKLIIRFLNVGQGDSTHLILPNGEHMLIDVNLDHKNRGIDVIQYLADELPKGADKRELAYNVNTHPHDDHIRGTGALGHDFEIGEMWHSGHELDCDEGENPEYDKYRAVVEDLGDKAVVVYASSDVWHEVDGVSFHVFRPSRTVKVKKSDADKGAAVHDECMVLKVSYAGVSVMFTGDSSKAAWESIMKHYNKDGLLKAQVLHASHHGSRTFFKKKAEDDDEYTAHLDAIGPESLVISVGAKNEHKHPHPDALKLYQKRISTSKTYRTDVNHTVELTIDEAGHMTWSEMGTAFQKEYELPDPETDSDDSDRGAGRRAVAASAAIVSKTRLGTRVPRRNARAQESR